MHGALRLGALLGLCASGCGRSSLGPDGGASEGEPIDGCMSIGAYDRLRLRTPTRAPAGCALVVLVNSSQSSSVALRLPADWALEQASWRPSSCATSWETGAARALEVSGEVTFVTSTSVDVELSLRFGSPDAPPLVALAGRAAVMNGCSD
ncbi:MAG: hypothetical protein ACOZQL_38080 [Myxococcota bacterium]